MPNKQIASTVVEVQLQHSNALRAAYRSAMELQSCMAFRDALLQDCWFWLPLITWLQAYHTAVLYFMLSLCTWDQA